jgi:hypothetical protein
MAMRASAEDRPHQRRARRLRRGSPAHRACLPNHSAIASKQLAQPRDVGRELVFQPAAQLIQDR